MHFTLVAHYADGFRVFECVTMLVVEGFKDQPQDPQGILLPNQSFCEFVSVSWGNAFDKCFEDTNKDWQRRRYLRLRRVLWTFYAQKVADCFHM